MCICCDIINNRISKEIAQKIIENDAIRGVYDALRGSNCDGEPIVKIIAFFEANGWRNDAIVDSSKEWRTTVLAKLRKKKEIRNEAKKAL